MSFQLLNEHLHKALEICGYKKPTPIQAQSIPIILEGKDLVASSETGSGKTAAFVLPALHYLGTQKPSKQTRILILTPTRELSSQINQAARDFGKFSRINIITLVGGMPYGPQIRDLARGADILVATPGRLMDHIENGRVNLSHIEMLILDEADRMLDMGFIEDVEYIAKLTPAKRQTLLFSATVDKKLMTVIKNLLKNPTRVDLTHTKLAPAQIKQHFYRANSPQQKFKMLKHFLSADNIFKAIIFSGTKINADKIARQLREDGFSAAALHGDLRQNVRTRTVEQLRRGKIQFLVATDVAARGIDIDDVTHVINYDLPRSCEDYVHRIGRTGRAGKDGVAISFVMSTDGRHIKNIERYTGQRINVANVNIDDTTNNRRSAEKSEYQTLLERDDQQSVERNEYRSSDRRDRRSGERSDYRSSDRKDRRSNERKDFRSDRKDRRSAERSDYRSSDRKDRRPTERSDYRSSDRKDRRSSERNDFQSDRKDRRPAERNDYRSSDRKDRRSSERNDFRSDRKDRRPAERSDYRSSDRKDRRSSERNDYQSDRKDRRPTERSDYRSLKRNDFRTSAKSHRDKKITSWRSEDKPSFIYDNEDKPNNSFHKKRKVAHAGKQHQSPRQETKTKKSAKKNSWQNDNRLNKGSNERGFGPMKKSSARKK